jgi:alpha-beta hydrolase superfamily lysophospholipase
MRTREQRLLNAEQRPDVYEELLIQSRGVPIALSIWKGNPGAPCIVFLPGTGVHPLFYEELLDGLSRASFNVVGVHFQGHGKSPRVDQSHSFNTLVQNGRDAIRYATQRFKGPLVVLGSSQSGMVTMSLASSDDQIAAVFAHNILDPHMADSIRITSFPNWLRPFRRIIVSAMNVTARLVPRLHVPIRFYLSEKRVFRTDWMREQYRRDPLKLSSYPLYFLASLFSADMRSLYSGQIRCPIVVIASTGDPLFPFDYIQWVYQQIKAPSKELLVFDLNYHLLFNECLEEVLPRLVETFKKYLEQKDAVIDSATNHSELHT